MKGYDRRLWRVEKKIGEDTTYAKWEGEEKGMGRKDWERRGRR